jgi:hypothetical protein
MEREYRRKRNEHPNLSHVNHDITPSLPWYFQVSIRNLFVMVGLRKGVNDVVQEVATWISWAVVTEVGVIRGYYAGEAVGVTLR